MTGIPVGFFIISNAFLVGLICLFIRFLFPNAFVMRIVYTLVGVYLIYLVAPRFVSFYIIYWCLIFVFGICLNAIHVRCPQDMLSKALTTAILVAALSPMILWKFFPDIFVTRLNEVMADLLWTVTPSLGFADAIAAIVAPLGLSFAVFRAVDLLIKIRIGLLPPPSLDRVLFYGFFPPILAVGPIAEYEEIQCEKVESRLPQSGDVAVSLYRIGFGLVKVFLVSFILAKLAGILWADDINNMLFSWTALLVYGLFFYVNFSGYSDLAIGISRLSGFRLKENFNNPYLQTNPSAFWSNWHMSLTRWVFRNVFTPLGGMRPNRQYFAIFVVIMVIAMWHAISIPLLIFGVYHGLILVVYRYIDNKRRAKKIKLSKNPVVINLKRFAVLSFVSLSLPLQSLPTDKLLLFYNKLIPFIT